MRILRSFSVPYAYVMPGHQFLASRKHFLKNDENPHVLRKEPIIFCCCCAPMASAAHLSGPTHSTGPPRPLIPAVAAAGPKPLAGTRVFEQKKGGGAYGGLTGTLRGLTGGLRGLGVGGTEPIGITL